MSKKEVVKASGAIQMTNKISLLQRRTWNILLANAFDDLLEYEEHHIEVKQLINTLEYTSKNEDHLKESLKELTTTGVEWNILQKDKTAIWGITTLLSQVEIKDGICTYAYSPALKKKLFQPRMYAKINLFIQNKFDSKHSLALYEICVDYYDRSRRKGETPFILIEDFRKLMGIEPHEYTEFKYLNKRTISEPIEEINTKSDVLVTVSYKRSGRKVSHVKFIVEPQMYYSSESGEKVNTSSVLIESNNVIDNLLLEYGINKDNIDYYKTYIPQDILNQFIFEFKEKIDKDLIRYPRPYLTTVLGKLATQYHIPLKKDVIKKEVSIENLSQELQFLLEEKLISQENGDLLLKSENRTIPLNILEQYSDDFWKRVQKKYINIKDKTPAERIELSFIESEREEDFMNHPVFVLLLETVEAKKEYTLNKLAFLQKITDYYWKIIEKEMEIERALLLLDNE